jgi:hypothetical protein
VFSDFSLLLTLLSLARASTVYLVFAVLLILPCNMIAVVSPSNTNALGTSARTIGALELRSVFQFESAGAQYRTQFAGNVVLL